jgi:putative phage-type endonuclease
MNRETITPENEAHWLSMRKQDITSTESAALFGLSPYMTEYELYHRKKSGDVPEFEVNTRMKWGTALEAAIAHGIAAENGWTIVPLKSYKRLPDLRIGSSFDFVITNHPSGELAHLEVKNVDFLAFRDGWIEHDDGFIEAPAHIELQVQHQMMVSGFSKSYIGALIGGNRGLVIERERDDAVIASLQAKIAKFWTRVDSGDEPPPIYPDDAAAIIAQLSYSEPGKILDATSDATITALCAEYKDAAARQKNAEEDKKVAQAKLLTLIGDAEKVLADGFKVSATMIADSPGTEITAEMIGTSYGARSGYRRLTITPAKGTK